MIESVRSAMERSFDIGKTAALITAKAAAV
jgi:hypothetical protein